jgi:hypothetical protein
MAVRGKLTGLAAILILAGCSTVGTDKPTTKSAETVRPDGLAGQELAAGECGLFLWSGANRQSFVFFQKQDVPSAKFYRDKQTMNLTTADVTSQLADRETIDINYLGPNGEVIHLKGQFNDEIEGGLRVGPATISVNAKDAWQEIIPVAGVYACQ